MLVAVSPDRPVDFHPKLGLVQVDFRWIGFVQKE